MTAAAVEERATEVFGCNVVAIVQGLQAHPLALRRLYHQFWQQNGDAVRPLPCPAVHPQHDLHCPSNAAPQCSRRGAAVCHGAWLAASCDQLHARTPCMQRRRVFLWHRRRRVADAARRCAFRMRSAADVADVQAYRFGLLYFQELRLEPEQQQQLAALWQLWRKSRGTLDMKLQSALEPLLKAGSVMDVAAQCPRARRRSDCGTGADGAMCTCPVCAPRLSRRMVGVSPTAHGAASVALRRLRDVLQKDGAAFAAVVQAAGMPGLFLTAQQVSQHAPLAVQQGVPFVDWLLICRVAHEDLASRSVLAGFA